MTTEHETVANDLAFLRGLAEILGMRGETDNPAEIRRVADRIERAHARDSAAQVGVPDGYCLMPLKGTPEIFNAMRASVGDGVAMGPVYYAALSVGALSAAPAPAAEPESALLRATRRLVFAARTSGGTAGRDGELCAALDAIEPLLPAPPSPEPRPAEPDPKTAPEADEPGCDDCDGYEGEGGHCLMCGKDLGAAPQPAPSDAPASPHDARCEDYPNCPNLYCGACDNARAKAAASPQADTPTHVYITDGGATVVGDPNGEDHSCDAMGCGHAHVLARLPFTDLRPKQSASPQAAQGDASLARKAGMLIDATAWQTDPDTREQADSLWVWAQDAAAILRRLASAQPATAKPAGAGGVDG